MKHTKIINFIGCPCSGKSTAAHKKMFELKREGYTAYFVSEFATDMILDGREKELKDQTELFKKQAKRFLRAYGRVDYIVCECPLILNVAYARFNGVSDPELEREVFKLHKAYNSENIYLPPRDNYSTENRVHSREDALKIDEIIKQVLKDCGQVYCEECHKVSTHPVKYGNLTLDYCKACQERKYGRTRD